MAYLLADLQDAVHLLRAGQLVAIPTETVYGLAALASSADAVARVFRAKGRPADHPLIVHLPGVQAASDWAETRGPRVAGLMAHFWPGPLTLVLPARDTVSRIITAGQDTVALRQPRHPLAAALLEALGEGLVAPSANRFMSVSPTCAAHVLQQFEQEPDLAVLDGGSCAFGLESTILAVLPGQALRILRPGGIQAAEITAVIGEPVHSIGSAMQVESPRVPGQHRRHYAPQTETLCWDSPEMPPRHYREDPAFGFLSFGQAIEAAGPCIDLGSDPVQAAKGLYAALYQLDGGRAIHIILCMPPQQAQWEAIRDRLRRAGAALN